MSTMRTAIRTAVLGALPVLAAALPSACNAPPAIAPSPTGKETIRVAFAGIDPGAQGTVNVALWSSAATFMKDKEWYRGVNIPARNAANGVVFDNVPPGIYAVSAFHDCTDCGKIRRGLFGIPIDPWATSNGSSPLVPPSWQHSKFEVGRGVTSIVLAFYRPPEKTP